jgi:hypothetical protein
MTMYLRLAIVGAMLAVLTASIIDVAFPQDLVAESVTPDAPAGVEEAAPSGDVKEPADAPTEDSIKKEPRRYSHWMYYIVPDRQDEKGFIEIRLERERSISTSVMSSGDTCSCTGVVENMERLQRSQIIDDYMAGKLDTYNQWVPTAK